MKREGWLEGGYREGRHERHFGREGLGRAREVGREDA